MSGSGGGGEKGFMKKIKQEGEGMHQTKSGLKSTARVIINYTKLYNHTQPSPDW